MTYESLLARQPASSLSGNRESARRFAEEIAHYLAGPSSILSTSQRNYLYKLRGTWSNRAAGKDARWEEFGNKRGRPRSAAKPTSAGVDPTAYGNPDELDPILKATMAKFGKRRVDGS